MKNLPKKRIKFWILVTRILDGVIISVSTVSILWLWFGKGLNPKAKFWINIFQNNTWKYFCFLLILIAGVALLFSVYVWRYNIGSKLDIYHGNDREWKLVNMGRFRFYIPKCK